MRKFGSAFALVASLALVIAWSSPAAANHQWSKYHWSQSSAPPLTLQVVDSTTSPWTSKLTTALSDWDASTVLNFARSNGTNTASARQSCDPVQSKIRVCNADYGNTGWLGVAQIWIYRGKGSHIAQGTVKNNDYYFGSSTYAYNNSNEMQHVICQEIGHTWGLDHQSEDGTTLNTCMDYYHNSSTSSLSTHPNQGDYDQLLCIYDPTRKGDTITSTISGTGFATYTHTCTGSGHLDGSGGGGPGGGPPPGHSRNTVHVSQAGEFTVVTFILWK